MRMHQGKSVRFTKIVLAFVLVLSGAWIALVDDDSSSQAAA